jgi:hypothetical protein
MGQSISNHATRHAIRYDNFFDCQMPEFCYLLGYLWADGWITNRDYRIQIIESDGLILKEILDSIDIHYSLNRKKSGTDSIGTNRNPSLIFCFGKHLKNFLKELNYDKKSYISHQKIMEFIPKENLHYWMRGYFDGDGCFYYNEKWKTKQANIGSTCNQDWTYFVDFLNFYNIKAKAFKKTHKKSQSKSSLLRFCGKQIVNFGEYIYQGKQFGLDRKYQKYLLIKGS